MPRIIIGAGSGYFFAILALAIRGDYFIHRNFIFLDVIGFHHEMLMPILIGAIMGWAWGEIAKR